MKMFDVEGLLQTSHRFLVSGKKFYQNSDEHCADSVDLNRYSCVIISMETKPSSKPFDVIIRYLKKQRTAYILTFLSLVLPSLSTVTTFLFNARFFKDYIWRALFEKTLSAVDFELVTNRNYRVCTVPWNILQSAGLNSLAFTSNPAYPKLDTNDFDIFIAQTPFPGRVDKKTTLIVRYHDALPVLMPHTIANKSRHQATHYYALLSNINSGAYFACVSESTRKDLLRLFPEVKDRAVTIHNMVSHHYYVEGAEPVKAVRIIQTRLNLERPDVHPVFTDSQDRESFYQRHLNLNPFRYLLVVSTLEPRKNHIRLIEAWETIITELDPTLKLVFVGTVGWDIEALVEKMQPGIEHGRLFVLNNVPADELRVLYRNAAVTVCPSVAEGFDFAGVESISSGGVVLASDISVHREVYDGAAEYFDPYSTVHLVDALKKVLYDPEASTIRETLLSCAEDVSLRYRPEHLLPLWEQLLSRINYESKDITKETR
ncbi:hypothetical protein SAMN02745119_02407 [Trichlorobacter thiogenes]|uniref:Glycosyl transferase family 1 domain-containing protein n=2 Tax=Trichlorobacter thiogenes TaxID=115783 RepID=A0A1T4QHR6_9BACT|nr:hypothetical protein SAMN02745119_02407 [Trichlorobacter thiogenes]